MDISREQAKDSLEQIDAVSNRTRRTIASTYDSALLIMWGLIWIAAFIGTHFILTWVWLIWFGLGGIGAVATFLVVWRQFRRANPIKMPADKKIGQRIFWFWVLLFVYAFVWLSILKPYHGIQVNAFLCTAIMFAYVVMGIWSESRYMLWLGLAVTGITLVGFYVIPPGYYCLWMAPTAGGALLGTGLYIRLRWR